MTRVLELVLSFPLPGASAGAEARASRSRRASRDFGAELVRAWRICAPVKMRRGHERVTLRAVAVPEGMAPGGGWHAWREEGAHGAQTWVTRARPLVTGVMLRETVAFGGAPPGGAPAASVSNPSADAPAASPLVVESSGSPEGAECVCERRRGVWSDASGLEVALTLDDIDPERPDGPARACELRLAVPDAGDAPARAAALRVLFAAARELCGAWPAFPLPAGIVTRLTELQSPVAHGAPLKAAPLDLAGIASQHDAFCALSSSVATQWFGNLGGVLDSGNPEYVHQLRVALRRLRTLTGLFPHYADAAWKEAFGGDLRWFGKVLGAVRDWDVFAGDTLPALMQADGDAAAWEGTAAAAQAQGALARVELRQAIRSDRYARFALAWLEWLSVFALTPAADSGVPLRRHAAKRVSRLFGRVYGAPPLTTLDVEACHRVRIEAKRLRYALEFFAPLIGRRSLSGTLKLLAHVQSVLGQANDLTVGLQRLEQLGAPPYQMGFARGYAAGAQRHAVADAEQWLADLAPLKFAKKK